LVCSLESDQSCLNLITSLAIIGPLGNSLCKEGNSADPNQFIVSRGY